MSDYRLKHMHEHAQQLTYDVSSLKIKIIDFPSQLPK